MSEEAVRTTIKHRAEAQPDGSLAIYQLNADGSGAEKLILEASSDRDPAELAGLVDHFNSFEFVIRSRTAI
ncbi:MULTISPECIES: hypothetical protein [Brevundimonas]|uniref:hypothetical protein n=1 Tax=Brevundimonas sp. UBA7507 TaxID=1946137 RepID=UPI00257A07B5|nr:MULTISPECIES: hypothetical protein [Brevundimonas]